MNIIEIIKKDWELIIHQQGKINKLLKNYNIYLIFHSSNNPFITFFLFSIVAIGLGIVLNEYNVHIVLIWVSILLIAIIVGILKFNISKSSKVTLVYATIFISIMLFFKKDAIGDFIGNNYIQGYSSWYEDGFDIHTETENTEHYFKTDNGVGSFILNCFNLLYFPFLLLVPYLTWKQLNKY